MAFRKYIVISTMLAFIYDIPPCNILRDGVDRTVMGCGWEASQKTYKYA